jgi:prepilin-type N-terminal cleavage/methylation domain-containing protein
LKNCKHAQKQTQNSQGFSLLELLFAMLIFSTSLLFIFSLFPAAHKSVAHARYAMMAAEVAKKEMEWVKSLDWNELEPNIQRPITVMTSYNNGTKTETIFIPQVFVTNYAKNPADNKIIVKTVRVQVKYEYASKQRVGATLETLVTKAE